MKITVITGTILITGLFAFQAFAGDVVAGKDKSHTCIGCHGVPNMDNVYPSYKAPKIGGQSAAYIISALKAYADGNRQHSSMRVQAQSMTNEDMADIAAYLESLK